ncbi:hypothetical protein PV04_06707 [Phialophora macrospora]|uniref:C3H1-type domain-containing protein n=1 Tax=Phialophora macrospora TaxID=1851006 RepID=A0A0D2FHC1_9EURO|nr:hypothetical protein PV04_06707 [Phialophora macrospora]
MRRPLKHLKCSGPQVFNSNAKQKKLRHETAFLLSCQPVGNHHEVLAKNNSCTGNPPGDLGHTNHSIRNRHEDHVNSIEWPQAKTNLCHVYNFTGGNIAFPLRIDLMTQEIANDNHLGQCTMGSECRFLHDPTKVALCPSLLQGVRCSRPSDCPFSHAATSKNIPTCISFLNGTCAGRDCLFFHRDGLRANAELCWDFAFGGYCEKGATCGHLHVRQCYFYAAFGTCPNLWCQLAHVANPNWNMQMPMTLDSKACTASTIVGPPADEEHDRVNAAGWRSGDQEDNVMADTNITVEEAGVVNPTTDEEADAVNTTMADDEDMDAVSDAGSFSLQDDYIAL